MYNYKNIYYKKYSIHKDLLNGHGVMRCYKEYQ